MKLYEIDYNTTDKGTMTFKELVVANSVEGAIDTFKANKVGEFKQLIKSVNLKRETILVEGV